jgi:hypothetical protein
MGRSEARLAVGDDLEHGPARFHPRFFCSSQVESSMLDNGVIIEHVTYRASISARRARALVSKIP